MSLCRWVLIWWLRLLSDGKYFWHSMHGNQLLPVALDTVWTIMWALNRRQVRKTLLHTSHLYGFFPPWILLCRSRLDDFVNCLQQIVHWNRFFSLVWLRLCNARAVSSPQHLPHFVHLYWLLWIFICNARPTRDKNCLWHSVHENIFPPVWDFMCKSIDCFVVNCLPHSVHEYGT